MSNQVLSCENVTASYGAIQALHGVNLEVNQGEIVVVLGANGAGKTTTLRAICNMVATDGNVMFNGNDISKSDTADIVNAGIAHVPQGRGTFAALTVLENLEVGAYTRTDDEVRSDIEMWFEKYPVLGERQTQAAGSLSGGEQQMLAVARAAMSRPTMMLLDEPSLGLAPLIIEDLFRAFAQLNKEQGTSMLLVEQNANLALEIAHRGYLLETGEITGSGSAEELRNDPAVQAAYLGA
ncbi:MAG: ABC transporter ATP-binding protein [Actinomycetota bacterium]|nr:ABC transporter ATP-binding protein [Actinomycetota bacterium]